MSISHLLYLVVYGICETISDVRQVILQGILESVPVSSSFVLGKNVISLIDLPIAIVCIMFFRKEVLNVKNYPYIIIGAIPMLLFGAVVKLLHIPLIDCHKSIYLFLTFALIISSYFYRSDRQLTMSSAALIGFAQIFASFSGVSRLGITLIAGMLCHIKYDQLFCYTWMISVPVFLAKSSYEFLSCKSIESVELCIIGVLFYLSLRTVYNMYFVHYIVLSVILRFIIFFYM